MRSKWRPTLKSTGVRYKISSSTWPSDPLAEQTGDGTKVHRAEDAPRKRAALVDSDGQFMVSKLPPLFPGFTKGWRPVGSGVGERARVPLLLFHHGGLHDDRLRGPGGRVHLPSPLGAGSEMQEPRAFYLKAHFAGLFPLTRLRQPRDVWDWGRSVFAPAFRALAWCHSRSSLCEFLQNNQFLTEFCSS